MVQLVGHLKLEIAFSWPDGRCCTVSDSLVWESAIPSVSLSIFTFFYSSFSNFSFLLAFPRPLSSFHLVYIFSSAPHQQILFLCLVLVCHLPLSPCVIFYHPIYFSVYDYGCLSEAKSNNLSPCSGHLCRYLTYRAINACIQGSKKDPKHTEWKTIRNFQLLSFLNIL